MKNNQAYIIVLILVLSGLFSSTGLYGQKQQLSADSILSAARSIMSQTNYCALVTVDSVGQPQTRTMNPFPNSEGFVIWFATSRNSDKVKEIRNNNKVTVYYADHAKGNGYVSLTGTATVIDDKELLLKMKRAYWEGIPNWEQIFVLIKILPEKLEVINYKSGALNDPITFKAPFVIFKQ